MSVEKIRLNKFIAMCGTCSRREADRLIEQGRVRINGSIAIVGATVTENDSVMVDNIPVSPTKEKVVLASETWVQATHEHFSAGFNKHSGKYFFIQFTAARKLSGYWPAF